jgi:hypothetical protein
MTNAAGSSGDLYPVFIYDGETFVGIGVIHDKTNIKILMIYVLSIKLSPFFLGE